MCLIDPEYIRSFEAGEAFLTKEALCTGCGEELWLDVKVDDVLICPKCGAADPRVIGTHYPDARH